jgi:hypothetical protein
MDIHVKHAIGTVKALEGNSLTLEEIICAVLSAFDDRQLRRDRAKVDTSVSSGFTSEQEHS